jgi:hypothetical protein
VPVATLARDAAVAHLSPLRATTGPALRSGSQPVVVFVGDSTCSFCAAESWAVVTALAHLGHWSGGTPTVSTEAAYRDTAGVNFRSAVFTSRWVRFESLEYVPGRRVTRLPAAADAAVVRLDRVEQIPFVDLGGAEYLVGSQYEPSVLAGRSPTAVAPAVLAGGSQLAVTVDAAAGTLLGELCRLTDGRPGRVCSAFPAPH